MEAIIQVSGILGRRDQMGELDLRWRRLQGRVGFQVKEITRKSGISGGRN